MSFAISGQKTIASAGTEEALGTQVINAALLVKALPGNTGTIYVGRAADGTLTSTSGVALAAGDVVVFEWVSSLTAVLVDAAVNGEGVAWLVLRA
jgi:hypothetical protein